MYEYEELVDRQDRIKSAMRYLDDALEEIESLGLEDEADLIKTAKDTMAAKLPELDEQICKANREEERAEVREFFDGIFASARETSFWTNYVEV